MLEILLTNDDGFDSAGILILRDILKNIANITIIAPSKDKSACSHSLSLNNCLKLYEIDENYYKIDDGTPSDCVFLALSKIMNKKPDLILSGINLGANLGEDTSYSGTVAGAFEGAMHGIRSIAFSQVFKNNYFKKDKKDKFSFDIAQKYIYDLINNIINNKNKFNFLDEKKILNINFPNCDIKKCKGIKSTQLGSRVYANEAMRGINPRGETYFWIGLHKPKELKINSTTITDMQAIANNYISVTPISLDITSYCDIKKIENAF